MGAGAVGVVVVGVELGDRARRLRRAVDLEQRRLEGREDLVQHGAGDRGGAVGHGAQLRPVAVGRPGHLTQELQHGRHQEGVGDPLLLHGVEQLVGDDVRDEHHAGAERQADQREAGSADVEQRHGDHADRLVVEAPVPADREQRPEVAVGEQHALGPPGRARGVELQDGVLVLRVGRRLGPLGEPVDPAVVVLPDDEDPPAVPVELLAQLGEVRTEDDEAGLGVVGEVDQLVRGEPEVEWGDPGADRRRGEEELEELHRVLAEPDHPAALDPQLAQAGGDPGHAVVELGVRQRAVAAGEGRPVATVTGVVAHDVGQPERGHGTSRTGKGRIGRR